MTTEKPFIVMQTDFGKGISTSTMDGVIHTIDRDLITFDSCHDIKPFDTYEASFCLYYVVPFWPSGTIFISVVDPGVGTDRKACVAKLKNGSYVVTPDNGSLTHMAKYIGIEEIRVIDEDVNRLQSTRDCSIFHGRDLFAYCAGKLASGKITYEEVGPAYPVDEVVMHKTIEPKIDGKIISGMLETADRHFGLICTNIPCSAIQEVGASYGSFFRCIVKNNGKTVIDEKIRYEKSFGYVEKGELFIMNSETLTLQIAKNYANASVEYDLGTGPEWTISFEKA